MSLPNMNENISEWVFDKYVEGRSLNNSDLLSIYEANGIKVFEDIEGAEDRQKDRMGRMPYITLFVDDNGKPVAVEQASPYLKDTPTGEENTERLHRGGSFENGKADARGHGSQGSAYQSVGFRYVISAVNL